VKPYVPALILLVGLSACGTDTTDSAARDDTIISSPAVAATGAATGPAGLL
jgi:hypothetical protein